MHVFNCWQCGRAYAQSSSVFVWEKLIFCTLFNQLSDIFAQFHSGIFLLTISTNIINFTFQNEIIIFLLMSHERINFFLIPSWVETYSEKSILTMELLHMVSETRLNFQLKISTIKHSYMRFSYACISIMSTFYSGFYPLQRLNGSA